MPAATLLLPLLLSLLLPLLPAAEADCPGLSWQQRGCYCYWTDPGLGLVRWSAAASLCFAVHPGAVLASPRSVEENTAVAQMAGLNWAWVGLLRFEGTEGEWRWADWAPLEYTNWFDDYPHQGQNCTAMFPGGSWETQDCDSDINSVICQLLAS